MMNPYAHFLEVDGRDALKVISATPGKLRSLMRGLTPAQIKKRVRPDKWSIHEIVLHLADCELMFASRCRLTAFDDRPFLQPFNQEYWMTGKLREKESTADAMTRFEVLRKSQLALYKALPKADFGRAGTHPERGEVTLRITFETCAGHDLNHLGQIEALRTALTSRRPAAAPKKKAAQA